MTSATDTSVHQGTWPGISRGKGLIQTEHAVCFGIFLKESGVGGEGNGMMGVS